ncbi:lysophospholipid acyltransferase family protein [Xylella taiwanensis]|nr:lysophospholipid acyltransferase family protein [Xylella taiwanensis]
MFPPVPQIDTLQNPFPENMPRMHGPLVRWLGRTALKLSGWRLIGVVPNQSKMVIIVAPHSSYWDGFLGFASKFAIGSEIRFLSKASLFWWPLGPLLRWIGCIPLDRRFPQGTVSQAVRAFRDSERMWYLLTPEGTRKRVERWKPGFWKIAKHAGVPIIPVYLDYPSKTIGIGELFWPGDDMDNDIAAIRAWYKPWRGKHFERL